MKRIYNYRTRRLYEFEDIEDSKEFDDVDDAVLYKLCVREEALADDVDVEDDVEFEERYETLEDAMADVDDAITKAVELEDEDFEELDCEDCNDCRVFESPSKRYIFVACLEDEDPDFEINVVDDGFERNMEDIPLDDVDELEDELDGEALDVETNESVSSKFARLRRLFEEEEENEESEEDDDESDDESDNASDEKGESDDDSEDDDSDEEMKAVVITVKTDDVDACKDELVDAGIAEDDIEVLDDKDGETDIRIDVGSIMELKDYLEKKGIDLEEEIGGEIVSDDEDESDDDSSDDSSDDSESEEGGSDETEDINFDDLGDIFGADA